MRYSSQHKAETRQKLIKGAGALAKKEGFGVTGVDGLMATVGLTGGAFYTHFSSKEELLKEIVRNELSVICENAASTATANDQLRFFLQLYLSQQHSLNPESGCVLPALNSEVARASDDVKAVFEEGVSAVQKIFARHTEDAGTAWALLALCVGGVALSRAVKSAHTQQQILTGCDALAETLLVK